MVKVKTIREKTGLVIDPYFSASKLRWLMDNTPGLKDKAREGKTACGEPWTAGCFGN